MDFKEAIQPFSEAPISRQLLFSLLKDYKRPYDKIHELVKQQQLVQLKRGMYVPGPKLNLVGPEPFLLANHLLGPSYVSVDSALFYWGFIPEKVFEITSATSAMSKIYSTPLGRYAYIHVPLPYYSFGIRQVQLSKKQIVLVASPEKALCDKVISTAGLILRSIKQTKEWLFENLRIDDQAIAQLNSKELAAWILDAPKSTSLHMLAETLKLYDKRMA
jgi:hypothetical protein